MSYHCKGCSTVRAAFARERLPPCRLPRQEGDQRQLLCKLFDVSLLQRHKGETFQQIRDRHDALAAGHQQAHGTFRDWPAREDFVFWLSRMHFVMFWSGEPDLAGRIRKGAVYFGSSGREYSGVPHHQIEGDLVQLYDTVERATVNRTMDRTHVLNVSALFLERYFMIHPFPDGNGRTARLALAALLRRWGYAFDDGRTTNSREARRYTRALDYAHIQNPKNGHPRARPLAARYFLQYLIRWLDYRILDVSEIIEELPPPPDEER